jgi:hypothetical protein
MIVCDNAESGRGKDGGILVEIELLETVVTVRLTTTGAVV